MNIRLIEATVLVFFIGTPSVIIASPYVLIYEKVFVFAPSWHFAGMLWMWRDFSKDSI
jgi:hypothetical protein